MLIKILIFALIVGGALITYFIYNKKNKNKFTGGDMKKVANFKESSYINETFKEVFDSIEYGKYGDFELHADSYEYLKEYDLDTWKCKVSNGEIAFTKVLEYTTRNNSGRRVNSRGLASVEFYYSFSDKGGDFEVGKCKLELPRSIVSNYSDATMYYRKGYDSDFKYFLYNLYKKWKDGKNEALKERADQKLKGMKMVIGKSSTRKSKIDKIIG